MGTNTQLYGIQNEQNRFKLGAEIRPGSFSPVLVSQQARDGGETRPRQPLAGAAREAIEPPRDLGVIQVPAIAAVGLDDLIHVGPAAFEMAVHDADRLAPQDRPAAVAGLTDGRASLGWFPGRAWSAELVSHTPIGCQPCWLAGHDRGIRDRAAQSGIERRKSRMDARTSAAR